MKQMKYIHISILVLCLTAFGLLTGNAQSPAITSFSPTSGSVGSTVTIVGSNFSDLTTVNIGGVTAIVVSNNGSQVVAMVMPNTTTGAVVISNASGTATSSNNFTVTMPLLPNTQQGNKVVGTGNTGAARQAYAVAISADGNTAIIGGYADNSNTGAAWVYVKSGGVWTQQGNKLVGTGAVGAALQGFAVAISADGNTAMVGGFGDNGNIGAVWVFVRNATSWSQQGNKLVGTGVTGTQSGQGVSVALSADGNTAIVGGIFDNPILTAGNLVQNSDGAAWVFVRSGTTWSQQGNKLIGSGSTGPASQGSAVSLSADGNIAAVGGAYDSINKGAVWIFTRSNGVWVQQGNKLTGTNRGIAFGLGQSVSLSADGKTLAMGCSGGGGVWIFTQNGGVWTQQGDRLNAKITNRNSQANFGYAVSMAADGNSFLVGAYTHKDASLATNQGAAWFFKRNGSIWTEQNKLVGLGGTGGSQQGFSVALSADGNTAISGGNLDNSNNGAFWSFGYVVSTLVSIKSFTPSSGIAGSSVTIKGSNFNATASNNIVYFGAIKANVITANDSTLVAIVPSGATHAKIIVYNTSRSMMAESRAYFTPSFSPANPNIVATDFAARVEFALGTGGSDMKTADFDGDGKTDVVSSNKTAGSVSVLRNTSTVGSVNFATKSDFAVLASPAKVGVQDIDGDGKIDIVTLSGTGISILKNTSTGVISFATKQDISLTSSSFSFITFSDVDLDGKVDIIINGGTGTSLLIFRNTSSSGSISFAAGASFNIGISSTAGDPQPISFGFADLDGDGKQDICVLAADLSIVTNQFFYYKNTSLPGIISFSLIGFLSNNIISTSTNGGTVGDLNNDGVPEIIYPDPTVAFKIFASQGGLSPLASGNVAYKTITKATGAGSSSGLPTIADLNGDGRPDLIASNVNNTTFSIYQNSTVNDSIQFANSFAVAGGTSLSPSAFAAVDLDGDDKPEIMCLNSTGSKLAVFRSKVQGIANPSISVTASLNSFSTCVGTASATQFFDIAGTDLTDSVFINSPNSTEISTASNGGFSNSISIAQSSGTIASTRIYIRVASTATGNINDSIVISSTGATTQRLSVIAVVKATSNSTNNLSICSSALPYSWNGSRTAAGTYTFTTTNSQGCDSVTTLNLTVKTNYTITASAGSNGSISNVGASTICEGNNQSYTITPNANYHIVDVLVDGVSQGAITTFSFTNVIANHTITASFAANCIASTSSTTQTACGSYVWGGTTYTASGDYVKHFTNSCGLDSAATLHLTINAATSSTQTASVCSNQLPFIWNGLIFNAAGTQTKTGLTNSKGCDSSATLTLSVATASTPTISVTSTTNNVCSGILVTFTAIATNQGTTPIYQWKKNGVNVGLNTNTYSSPSLVTNDSVWCVLTSNSACATTATATSNKIKMTVRSSPLVSPVKSNIGVDITSQTMCTIGGAVTLYNSYWGGTWSSSNPSIATVTNGALVTGIGISSSGLLTAVSNGIATVTYTITASNGCPASASATVFVDAVPTLNANTGGSSVCIGSSLTLSNTSVIPFGGSGVWASTAGRATVNATTGVVTGVNAGTGSIKYTITNANGCSSSAVTSMVVNSLPGVPTINYATGTVNPQAGASGGAFCNNRTFTLVGNPTGGVWSTTNASVVTVTSGGLTKTVGVGSGSIVYTYTNANGCSSSRSIVGNVVTCVPRGVNGGTNEKQETRNEFTMYPNPAKSFISLNVNTLIGAGSIVVTDLYGKQVKTQSLSMGTNTIDVSSFAKGIYFVSTITSEGKTTKKLVVE